MPRIMAPVASRKTAQREYCSKGSIIGSFVVYDWIGWIGFVDHKITAPKSSPQSTIVVLRSSCCAAWVASQEAPDVSSDLLSTYQLINIIDRTLRAPVPP